MIEATSSTKRDGNADGSAANERKSNAIGIRLTPVDNSDSPVLSNYSTISVAPGMAFIDFGFLEPAMLAALPRVAKQGGKLPANLNGKLAVRVAMGYDAVAMLHQQLGRVLNEFRTKDDAMDVINKSRQVRNE